MKAFVAGATGYTGRELVRELRARGAAVSAHVRPDSARLDEWRRRFEALGALVDTTPWQPAELQGTLSRLQPSHVFALLGTTARRARGEGMSAEAAYEAIDYGLTVRLLEATRAAAPHARFIYLSAFGASERGNAYLRARGRVERVLRDSGVSWIAARPLLVTGPDREERRVLERVAARATDAALEGLATIGVRRPAERWHSLSGAQLAAALAELAGQAPDGIYEADALRHAAAAASPATTVR